MAGKLSNQGPACGPAADGSSDGRPARRPPLSGTAGAGHGASSRGRIVPSGANLKSSAHWLS